MSRSTSDERPGFIGVLESPLEDGRPLLGAELEVRGWAMPGSAVTAVRVRLDGDGGSDGIDATIDIERPDVARAWPERPDAGRSGFVARISPADRRVRALLQVEVHAAGAVGAVHRWERAIEFGDADAAYRRWRFAPSGDERPSRCEEAPRVTWIVRAPEGGSADDVATTVETVRLAGADRWQVLIDRRDGGPAPWTPWREAMEGDWLGLLLAGDRLQPDAGARLAAWLHSRVDLLYCDHDHADDDGPVDPVFKPGWSPTLQQHPDIARAGWLIHRDMLDDATWQALAAWDPHRPILPHRLARPPRGCLRVPEPIVTVARRPGHPVESSDRTSAAAGQEAVTVVIPTRLGDADLLRRCLDGVTRELPRGSRVRVVLNNLAPHHTARDLAFLGDWPCVDVLHAAAGPFNWSALNNFGAADVRTPWLLFLNDDVEPIDGGWLAPMLDAARAPGVGVVGAVLLYPDSTVQHAGIYVNGADRPECRHLFRHCTGAEPQVGRWLRTNLDHTAVTGACLLTRADVFRDLGGFDATLPLVYNDVDYCLRMKACLNLDCTVAADARLVHHEGTSRGGLAEEADRSRFDARWSAVLPPCDPYSHPVLARDRDDWMLDAARPLARPVHLP